MRPGTARAHRGSIILDRLCTEYSSRVELVRLSGVPAIVALLSAATPEVKRGAVRVLLKLLDEYDVRSSMCSLNGI